MRSGVNVLRIAKSHAMRLKRRAAGSGCRRDGVGAELVPIPERLRSRSTSRGLIRFRSSPSYRICWGGEAFASTVERKK